MSGEAYRFHGNAMTRLRSICTLAIFALTWLSSYHAAPLNDDDKLNDITCGYDSCPATKPGVLNVHLICHTHDDVGWLKTVDQYYYGSNSSIQRGGVQYIIDAVVEELYKDPARRFIYVETSFLWKWWEQQDDVMRHRVKKLVDEGRLEMIGGAWSMNDEATTNYHSIVDQFTWGLRKLNDTFGECGRPRVGWQIDPFGHSREMANLLAGMGYDGLFLGRIDYEDKVHRFLDGKSEMIWRGNDDLKGSSDLFTGILFNTYFPPPGFCFDILCTDEPIIDDISSPDYNVKKKVAAFLDFVTNATKSYQTDHVAITMGRDFYYQDANVWYKNLDKLIKYVHRYGNVNGPRINVIYSTPSCYLKSLHDANLKWPTKQDDFFPYASDPHAFWVGYFTSKPAIKYFERKGNNFLQVCKQLYAMNNLAEKDLLDLNALRTAMGILQHHDAITGTEKEHVAKDYERILDIGMQDCLIPSKEALSKQIDPEYERKKENNIESFPMKLCNWNVSECDISETSNTFIVTVYNPLSHSVTKPVRLPVSDWDYSVIDNEGGSVTTQTIPIPAAVLNIVNRDSSATNELVFLALDVPALGFKNYYVSRTSPRAKRTVTPEDIVSGADDIFIGSDKLRLQLDAGNKISLFKMDANQQQGIEVTQNFLYYQGYRGNNAVFENRSSGAYIFRPNGEVAIGSPKNTVYKGPVVEEIHQYFNDWISQIIRIYKNANFAEYEWTVGPIPIDDGIGKEVVTRFSTNLDNSGAFYTDSNGRQMLKRIVDNRPTWKPTVLEPISSNYYPITSRISIRDEAKNLQFSVLTDRAQGGSSIHNGQVEVMVHRRLLGDDDLGVDEALNEMRGGIGLVARGKHVVQFGKIVDPQGIPQEAADKIKTTEELLSPWIFISNSDNTLTLNQWKPMHNVLSGLVKDLPPNVHILTLEPWKDNSLLLRLEHLLQAADDPDNLSKPVQVNLGNLFRTLRLESIRETTLAANQWLSDSKRMRWQNAESFVESYNDFYGPTNLDEDRKNAKDVNESNETRSNSSHQQDDFKKWYQEENSSLDNSNAFVVSLDPMEIRTFIVKASKMI